MFRPRQGLGGSSTGNWLGLVFIWDDLQAPNQCASYTQDISSDPNTAYNQGRTAGLNAYTKLNALGRDEYPSAIYLDIEYYNSGNVGCRNIVNSYIKGWTEFLRATPADKSGVYSSSGGAIKGMVDGQCWTGGGLPGANVGWCPDAIWMARYNNQATVWGDATIPDGLWFGHARMHQYVGGHDETWNGMIFNIDSDCNLAPVAGGLSSHDPNAEAQTMEAIRAAHPNCP